VIDADGRSRTTTAGGAAATAQRAHRCSASAEVARVGFEPTSRAHEAREDSRSSTARRDRSGRQESNLRSPVPKTGGVASSPTARRFSFCSRKCDPGAASAAPGKSTTVESNHALPPYQSGAVPSWLVVAGFARNGASPGNRTLLHGVTARGLATSLATQVSPGGFEPPWATVGAWCSSTERRREGALDGNRTRLTR
jgi:hypothetical protein